MDVEGGRVAVDPDTFAEHMALLAERSTCDLHSALTGIEARQPPMRRVVITLDDAATANHHYILDPLVRYHLPAIMYAPSLLIGQPGYVSRSQLKEMAAAGVEVGAHGRTHADLRGCSDSELESEIRGSRGDLEDMLGQTVTSFAYPDGAVDRRVLKAVVDAGFSSAVTSRRGWLRRGTDPFLIPRTFVENFDQGTFRSVVQGGLAVLSPLYNVSRAVLGR